MIPVDDYVEILRWVRDGGDGWRARQTLLERWYGQVDENAIPPVHYLQPRPARIELWPPIERALGVLLRQATVGFSESRRLQYVASSTEQDGTITSCALSPDGRTVIAGETTGRVHVLRRQSARVKQVTTPPGAATATSRFGHNRGRPMRGARSEE